ncbi:hypothetical protein [Rickettsia felis]|nr:hypothetical protein [Rickettsia felis]
MDTKSSLREDAIGVDEAISGKVPEIATLLSVARNDDLGIHAGNIFSQ